jgi:DtxR family transcriptional regulator, Mn-dependent transcriptional regulator
MRCSLLWKDNTGKMAESESTEMYLKTILELEDADQEPVAISRIAERLGVSAVSANEMIKRLAERDLVLHTPYKGVEFTELGRRRGLNVLRRHRLWECFLVDFLDVAWEHSHDLACQLEHATADEVTERLAAFLGQPETCPHGSVIPDAEGHYEEPPTMPLSEMEVGQKGTIRRIYREETPLLDYLAERDVLPGLPVSVRDIAPYNGPLTARVGDGEVVLGREIAARILITRE